MFRSKCGSFVPYCSGGYQKCTGHKKKAGKYSIPASDALLT